MLHKRIFYVANVDWFFISHRLPLAIEAKKRGFEVYILAKNTGERHIIESHGLNFIEVEFNRAGKNPFKDLRLIFVLRKLYKVYKPDYIHHVTIKPTLYGSIAALLLNYPSHNVINAISGLGAAFTKSRFTSTQVIVRLLMRIAYGIKRYKFIFQNPDDKALYQSMGFLTASNFCIIKGSGVDLSDYQQVLPVAKERLKIILPARMLIDKGLVEFAQAAKILYAKHHEKVEFCFIGGIDELNPAAISKLQLEQYLISNYLTWKGHVHNMKQEYIQSDIVCLPSYREGLPKSLVEAMAIGRPIITTDAPGCKECVLNGVNGYIVPIKNAEVLAQMLDTLLEDKQLRIQMGNASREIVEKEMSLQTVISQTFDFYKREL